MVAGIFYFGILYGIRDRAQLAQYGIVVGIVDIGQRAARHLADKAAGAVLALDIAGIVARIDDIVRDGSIFDRFFCGRSVRLRLRRRVDIDIGDCLFEVRCIFQIAHKAAGIGDACDSAIIALQSCICNGLTFVIRLAVAALDDFVVIIDNQLARLGQRGILIGVEHAVHIDTLGMAHDAAGIGRTCHLAGVVGIGIVVNRRAGAEDGAVLHIARNAAYVFGAGDGSEIAHIRESAAIRKRSGNAAGFCSTFDCRAIGNIPHGAVVNEAGESADTLTLAGHGAGCTGPADMRTVLQGTGYRTDLVSACNGNITERQVHKFGRITGRPCCSDQAHIILFGAVDCEIADAKDPFTAETVDGAGKGIRSVADGIEALTAVPLVRVDVFDFRIVKMRTLEFIISLLEWGFQCLVVTDGLLQGIVLRKGRGRICQGSPRRIKQTSILF